MVWTTLTERPRRAGGTLSRPPGGSLGPSPRTEGGSEPADGVGTRSAPETGGTVWLEFPGERERERGGPEAAATPHALGACCVRRRRCPAAPRASDLLMILPQVHLRKPCYDFYFL